MLWKRHFVVFITLKMFVEIFCIGLSFGGFCVWPMREFRSDIPHSMSVDIYVGIQDDNFMGHLECLRIRLAL